MRPWLVIAVAVGWGCAAVGVLAMRHEREAQSLAARAAALAPVRPGPPRPCTPDRGLVLLVLGQSNAANHGGGDAPDLLPGPTVTVFDGRHCRRAADPLPFATGRGRTPWTGLEAAFAGLGQAREVVVALLAIDSTTIDDWVRGDSPVHERLRAALAALAAAGLQPDAVLWQQGESDARRGTAGADYEDGLERLREQIRAAGVDAPLLVAHSTRCRNERVEDIRAATDRFVARHADVLAGPDTDRIAGADRIEDCHWSRSGLDRAARAWAEALLPLLPRGGGGETAAR